MDWSGVVAVIAFLLVAVHLSTADRHLVEVTTADGTVTLTPRGLMRVWAFRRRISIPLRSIRSVRVAPDARELPKGLRLPGTAIPGLILAGTFLKRGEWSFYALRDGKDVLLLELDEHRYRRVVIQTRDPFAVAQRITSAITPSSS